ncbi:MAG: peptidylprolyl isomerase [Alteraurantiacibacter sp.]
MKFLLALSALTVTIPAIAQDAEEPATPGSILASASADEWRQIAPADLLVMQLAPEPAGKPRTVVIQLAPEPFSQPWVENIRILARARWWDGTSVYRVQDNYVTQWGDVTEEKPLPEGVASPLVSFETTGLLEISDPRGRPRINYTLGMAMVRNAMIAARGSIDWQGQIAAKLSGADENFDLATPPTPNLGDRYSAVATHVAGWPIAGEWGGPTNPANSFWPIHCYGYIGVARDYAPDTGTGAELYTIIGQPQRHMDRNLAVVGRVIKGMEHLSSLPRGSGELGFYTEEEAGLRTPIMSVRLASELDNPPAFEYLDTASNTFARYITVRANRDDAFYTKPAGGVDVCNVQVPVRSAID